LKLFNKRYLKLVKIISYGLDCLLVFFPKSNVDKEKIIIKTILVFDFHLIGDIVLLLPFLNSLKKKYPYSSITLVAGPWAADILSGSNLVDDIVFFSAPWVRRNQGLLNAFNSIRALTRKLKKKNWDLGIEVRGDIRQIILLWLVCKGRRIGFNFTGGKGFLTDIVPDDGVTKHIALHHKSIAQYINAWPGDAEYLPKINLTQEEVSQSTFIKPFIGFHFGASLPLRRMPEDQIEKLLSLFKYSPDPLVIFLDVGDNSLRKRLEKLIENSNLNATFSRGSLRNFIIAVSRSKHMFVMDSGPAHISSALGIPTTVFYGPANPAFVRPLGLGIINEIMIPDLSCRPCNQINCSNPIYQYCMKGIIDKNINSLEIKL
jgi:ADP-heptose:LPS heptosyltransferase